MKGMYVRWLEIIEEFTFAVIHGKVIVEDCISREPRHLLEPTMEDRLLKRDYESDPEPAQDLETLAKAEAALAQREETLWQIEELRRSSRVVKPTKWMEQYCLQQRLFQEGSDKDKGKQPWEESGNLDDKLWKTRIENQDTTPEAETMPETEEIANEEDWMILKDNQLWEKQDATKKGSWNIDNGEKAQADGTIEKGLGPTDTLLQTGNPYEF